MNNLLERCLDALASKAGIALSAMNAYSFAFTLAVEALVFSIYYVFIVNAN